MATRGCRLRSQCSLIIILYQGFSEMVEVSSFLTIALRSTQQTPVFTVGAGTLRETRPSPSQGPPGLIVEGAGPSTDC